MAEEKRVTPALLKKFRRWAKKAAKSRRGSRLTLAWVPPRNDFHAAAAGKFRGRKQSDGWAQHPPNELTQTREKTRRLRQLDRA